MTAPGDRQDATTRGVTVAEAAARLGVTPDAVRRPLHRGTLAGDKTEEGQWRVWLPEPSPEPSPVGDAGDHQDTARQSPGSDRTPPGRPPADTELIDHLQSEVAYLRSALDSEMEARRRADHLVAGLMERLPELAATVEDAAVTPERAPTAHERREAFWHTPAGAPTTLRAWIRRLTGR